MSKIFVRFAVIFFCAAFAVASLAQESATVDLESIRQEQADRLIAPDCDDPPTYCLLVIGPTAEHQIVSCFATCTIWR